jgi:F420-dependent oxidoreductase-like protein
MWDHFMLPPPYSPPGHSPMLECFVALGALAAITERVKLGQLVLGVPYRNPALVAKMATTLDVISHGRSILGVGAAWMEREFEGYGFDFEERGARMRRLEEAVRLILTMWQDRPASFSGEFYRAGRALNDPPAVQRPHPPIMIGGSGEQVTLKLVAKYAQWCNVQGDPDTVRHRFEVLREHCRKVGRDPAEIVFSNYGWVIVGRDDAEAQAKLEKLGSARRPYPGIAGGPDTIIRRMREYAAVGSQCMILQMTGQDAEDARLFGETVMPALASS